MKPDIDRRQVIKALVGGVRRRLAVDSCRTGRSADGRATLILRNGKVTTLDASRPDASAIAIAGGRFAAVGE